MTRGPQCRYTLKYQRCGNVAIDPVGEVLLCEMHLARTMELLRSKGFEIVGPRLDVGQVAA